MAAQIIFLLSLSIIFPFLVGLLRFKAVVPRYRILLILFATGLVAELLSRYALSTRNFSWIPSNNLYILVESMLIPLQFYAWGYLRKTRVLLYSILGVLLAVWITEHLLLGNIMTMYPYYRMFYSLVIVLISINTINYLVIHEQKMLLGQPVFIICCAFIIFFTYQLFYEGIYNIVTNLEEIDTGKLNTAFSIINFFCNILYGIALLLVPSRSISDWLGKKTTR